MKRDDWDTVIWMLAIVSFTAGVIYLVWALVR